MVPYTANQLPKAMRDEITQAFGFVPSIFLVLPHEQTNLWWSAMRDFQLSDKTALSNKVKELIGLGVAAQIPCHYCILFHTEAARLNGASEREIEEAVFMASLTRQGSTILNGVLLDTQTFDKELRDIVSHVKKAMAAAPTKR